jgi:homoserine O-acetyltransferase
MTELRAETLRRYGMTDEATIRRAATLWATVFDANSLLILGRAAEAYDVTAELDRIRVPVLYVLSRTDALFPPERAPGVMQALRDAGVDAAYFEIDSDKGHLASGADAGKWAPALRDFMRRVGAAA